MRNKISSSKFKDDLIKLGISKGDVLLLRAGLKEIGVLESRDRNDYVKLILDVLGPEGTLVALSFTNSFLLKKNKKIVFDKNVKANTGAFANIMITYPNSVRSEHPTNSFVAIGKHAEFILKDHDHTKGAYYPMKKIIELGGKMALVGCVDTSPGFTTTHFAEVNLGLHKKIIFPTFNRAFYKKGNQTVLFKRRDLGSCSSTFYRFYSYYVYKKLLKQSDVGSAYSVLIDAREAYEVDCNVLINNKKITICSNSNCFLCRARRWDNLIDIPRFIMKKILNHVSKRFKNG